MSKIDKSWEICEVQYVIDNYKTMTYEQMGICLERTTGSVQGMMDQLGIRKLVFKPKKYKRKMFNPGVRDWLLGDGICL